LLSVSTGGGRSIVKVMMCMAGYCHNVH
jgi:hypothetical protein